MDKLTTLLGLLFCIIIGWLGVCLTLGHWYLPGHEVFHVARIVIGILIVVFALFAFLYTLEH
jgi:TRAP-type C4-dicarboxylate transport system permease small subunit